MFNANADSGNADRTLNLLRVCVPLDQLWPADRQYMTKGKLLIRANLKVLDTVTAQQLLQP